MTRITHLFMCLVTKGHKQVYAFFEPTIIYHIAGGLGLAPSHAKDHDGLSRCGLSITANGRPGEREKKRKRVDMFLFLFLSPALGRSSAVMDGPQREGSSSRPSLKGACDDSSHCGPS